MDDLISRPLGRTKLKAENVDLYYGAYHALTKVTCDIPSCAITAIIGPSGCGKSSLLRIFNRMNDLIPSARVEGKVFLDDTDIYERGVDVVSLREAVGMVFQKPNPFPMSIYDNVVIGPRHHGIKGRRELLEIAERALSQVALWGDVKDKLRSSAAELSPGDQQRLCIARALATKPEVLLMDESTSALDPESTMKIEALMLELAKQYTIIIVTHNMEQARRVSDMSAFLMLDDDKVGTLVEYAPTAEMFSRPQDRRTEDYITGRFG